MIFTSEITRSKTGVARCVRLANLFVPMCKRELRSQDDRPALVAIVTELQKVAPLAIFQRSHGEIIQHQNVDAGKLRQQAAETSVDVCHRELAEQL